MKHKEPTCGWCNDPVETPGFCDPMCERLNRLHNRAQVEPQVALRVPRLTPQSELRYHGDNYNG